MSDQQDAAAHAYQAALRVIEEARKTGETHVSFDLEDCRALTEIPGTLRDIPGLESVDHNNTRIADLSPLRGLTGLQSLSLSQTAVADLSPLRGLTGLQELSLNQTAVADLSPLRDLTGLQSLSFSQTAVADLSPLRGLTGLQSLSLYQTAVADLSPLRDLTGLQGLSLSQTAVADLSPLRSLTGLQGLSLEQTAVSDLSPLSGLTGLQVLFLSQTAVTDLSPLRDLTGLEWLHLNQTAVADLSPLRGLTGLQTLYLSQTAVTDLSPLRGLTALQGLSLDYTAVADLSPLRGLTGLQELSLDYTAVADLSPLRGLIGLQSLSLSQTTVADLSPLSDLTGLHTLSLSQTAVAVLSPLRGLTGLQMLFLNHTAVADLRPICNLGQLGEGAVGGLWFADTPATRHDPELARLAGIGDFKDRTRQTLAYLRSLPPWPEPLPWVPPDTLPDGPPPPTPEADAVPRIIVVGERLDLDSSPLDAVDVADPIKARLYAKLPEAVAALHRFGNRYPEVAVPAEALRQLVAMPFAQADLLDIHIQIAALTDLREANGDRAKAEQLDPDCLMALNGVLRLGPPVTLGHPDVDLFEERNVHYARLRLPATVAEGERRVAAGLAEDEALATDRLRKSAGQLAKAGDEGRLAAYRNSFNRAVIIAAVYVAGSFRDAVIGIPMGEAAMAAVNFLVLHKDAIMATAPAWGESGWRWLEYILIRAKQIVDEARRG